mmetsp:Transcript_30043/g.50810  ORF Transcript_30043/g.50810 Transcript_30043/m.50810 type:complete len:97 (+) Transcript_30043:500-790(+)
MTIDEEHAALQWRAEEFVRVPAKGVHGLYSREQALSVSGRQEHRPAPRTVHMQPQPVARADPPQPGNRIEGAHHGSACSSAKEKGNLSARQARLQG